VTQGGGALLLAVLTMPIRVPPAEFLDHVPVALTFGTSGLRGLVTDITDLEAYINVKGALRYLLDSGDVRAGELVVLAGDLRPSTDRIMRACARAIVDSGCLVENAGKIPTPALILHAVANRRAGVMVSGSHIPFDRNGIKLSKSGGEILKSDEAGITQQVERVRVEEYGRTAASSAFDPCGMLKKEEHLPPLDRSAEERYVRRYVACFARAGLSGLRVLVYEHSAVGRDVLGRILRELGAEVVPAGRAETFVPIDTENVTPELLDRLEGLVRASAGGRPIHAIVSTDGDSDRPLVTAVLADAEESARKRRVRFLPGDLLGIVVAEYLRADAVAVPISANDAVERRMKERGVLLETTKIGSPFVISGMEAIARSAAPKRIVGWEANGGFLVGSAIDIGGETLGALPTRDAMLPILANLFAAAEAHVTLPSLWDRLPARYGAAGLIDDVPVPVSRSIAARLVVQGDVVDVGLERADRVVDLGARASTPAQLAPPAADAWRERQATLKRFFTPAMGFDDIVRINILDGVRIYFKSGDVAHIRASGNAPQLRIYANSDSQARADEIVAFGLREPDGILRSMEKALT
jgi:phosphomannomutase